MKPCPLLGRDRAPSGQPLTRFPTGKTPQTSPHEHLWLPRLPHLQLVKENLEYGRRGHSGKGKTEKTVSCEMADLVKRMRRGRSSHGFRSCRTTFPIQMSQQPGDPFALAIFAVRLPSDIIPHKTLQ